MQFDLNSVNRYLFGLCNFSNQSITQQLDVTPGLHCPQQHSLYQATPSDRWNLHCHPFLDSLT